MSALGTLLLLASHPAEAQTATLLIHYNVNDAASWNGLALSDLQGSANDLTPSAGVVHHADGGWIGRAYLDFPDFGHLGASGKAGDIFNPVTGGGYTMEGVFYVSSAASASDSTGIGFGHDTHSENQFIEMDTNGYLRSSSQVDDGAGPLEDYEVVSQDINDIVPRDRWFHVVKVFDASSHEVRWYVGGLPVISKTVTMDPDGSAAEFHPRDENYGGVGADSRQVSGVGYCLTRFYRGVLADEEIEILGKGITVSISATDASAAEGGSDPGVFTLARKGVLDDPLTVNIGIRQESGDAAPGNDYATQPSTFLATRRIEFAAGVSEVTITIVPSDDDEVEDVETVCFSITTGSYRIAAGMDSATVDLLDGDMPPGAFGLLSPPHHFSGASATPTLTWETSSNATSYTLVVDDDSDFSSPVLDESVATAAYTISSGVIANGTRYWWDVTAHSPVQPPPGGVGATNGPFDFWTVPVVTVTAEDSFAFEDPADNAVFTIVRQGALTSSLVVSFVLGGDAVNGQDYVTLASQIAIGAGGESTTITVRPLDNSDIGEKTVSITLVATPDYVLGEGGSETASAEIGDDDSSPQAFGLTIPGDGATHVEISDDEGTPLALTLGWQAAAGALTYAVEVTDNESDWADPVFTAPLQAGLLSNPPTCQIPAGTLSHLTQYWWRLTASNGVLPDTVSSDAPWTFTTEADTVAPRVVATEPRDGDDQVEAYSSVEIRFSEPMDTVATEGALNISGGVTGVLRWTDDGRTVRLVPDRELAWETSYVVTITTAAKDKAVPKDNALNDEYTFSFTTAEELRGLGQGEGCVASGQTRASFAAACVLVAAVSWSGLVRRRRRPGARAPEAG